MLSMVLWRFCRVCGCLGGFLEVFWVSNVLVRILWSLRVFLRSMKVLCGL